MPDTNTRSFLAEHPKLMGALFAMMLLLTQVGTVAAGNAHGWAGP